MPVITLPSGREVDLDANPAGATEGRPSNLPANHPGGWDPAYGGVPQIPDPIAAAWQALGGNMDLLPGLFSMGNAYNLFNNDQRMGQVQGTPGFSGVLSNLSGQLPQDVVDQLAQRGAERGVLSGGAPDSPNTNAAYLRALGLNSLDLQNRGQQQLNSLLSQFRQADPFNLMSGLVSAEDQQAANAAANVNASAPNPRDAALEEQRKLLEAIEAGKRAAGAGGPAGSGGVDYGKILDLIKGLGGGSGNPKEGTYVGHGPNQTVNRGVDNTTYPAGYRPYVDPGATGGSGGMVGRPNDVIQNAFKPPGLGEAGTLGMGLNPQVNAFLRSGGLADHMSSNGFSNYGGGGYGINFGGGPSLDNAALLGPQGLGPTYGDPWSNDTTFGSVAPNDWLNSPNPFDALSNINWLEPDASTHTGSGSSDWLIDPNDLAAYMSGGIDLPGSGPLTGGMPWQPDYGDIFGAPEFAGGDVWDSEDYWW